jgi:dihydroorotase
MTATTEITIRQPDDFHVHLRDGDLLARVLPYTAKVFGRALVMPNLTPPVLTVKDVKDYAQRIQDVLYQTMGLRHLWRFSPLYTIKLTGSTTPEIVQEAKDAGVVAAKLYPAGVTTNSADGVSDFQAESLHSVFSAMAECGMVLCVHAETPGSPSLLRETDFITRFVIKWADRHPSLKIVIEHATTLHAVQTARDWANIACSLTVHHMLLTLDDVIGDKLNPHCFCKPVAKTEGDRQAIIEAAIGGGPEFFLGTDSAPHIVANKHTAHAAAGCFTAPVAVELLAQIFDDHGSLNTLEMFASENGANFYGLPLNEGKIRLVKKTSTVPERCETQAGSDFSDLIPFWAGKEIQWEVAEVIHERADEADARVSGSV